MMILLKLYIPNTYWHLHLHLHLHLPPPSCTCACHHYRAPPSCTCTCRHHLAPAPATTILHLHLPPSSCTERQLVEAFVMLHQQAEVREGSIWVVDCAHLNASIYQLLNVLVQQRNPLLKRCLLFTFGVKRVFSVLVGQGQIYVVSDR